jgi:hypothetical protein
MQPLVPEHDLLAIGETLCRSNSLEETDLDTLRFDELEQASARPPLLGLLADFVPDTNRILLISRAIKAVGRDALGPPGGGGNTLRYVRLRPRASLASILDERAYQALPAKVNGLIAKMTVETLNLRPNMLVNVTPVP